MRRLKLPPRSYLLQILRYDRRTGFLHWRVRRSQRVLAGDVAGTYNSWGYVQVKINGVFYLAHYIIWLMEKGWLPRPPNSIDHEDRTGSNNKQRNLRIATPSQQMINRRMQKSNTTGYVGVTRYGNQFVARISVRGRRRVIGIFSDVKDAASARHKEELRVHREFVPVERRSTR